MAEQTYWNGEPTPCRRVRVKVGTGEPGDPYLHLKWWRGLEGTERDAVVVEYGSYTYFLDDEDGSGWRKVTVGHGSPRLSSSSLPDDSVVLADR